MFIGQVQNRGISMKFDCWVSFLCDVLNLNSAQLQSKTRSLEEPRSAYTLSLHSSAPCCCILHRKYSFKLCLVLPRPLSASAKASASPCRSTTMVSSRSTCWSASSPPRRSLWLTGGPSSLLFGQMFTTGSGAKSITARARILPSSRKSPKISGSTSRTCRRSPPSPFLWRPGKTSLSMEAAAQLR